MDETAGTCEQNYLYPAQLFGYYALQVYLMLKQACTGCGPRMEDRYRYIYLATFFNHIGEVHRSDIASLKWSSEHVESHWH